MYYVWKANFENETLFTKASIVNVKDLARVKLLACQSLKGILPPVILKIETPYPLADFFSAGPMFLVSDKLRCLLELMKANIEYHPVAFISDSSGSVDQSYFFANILEKVDCFDYKASAYSLDGQYIDKIQKMVIDESKVGNKPLMRLANSFDVIVLVSHGLVDLLQAEGITGVKFEKPENWKW